MKFHVSFIVSVLLPMVTWCRYFCLEHTHRSDKKKRKKKCCFCYHKPEAARIRMQDKLSGGGWAQISTLRSSKKTKTKCERRDEIP